jgi:hypothetical protein
MDPGFAVIVGVVLGSGLSYVRAIYEWYGKRRRYEAAICVDIRRAARTIDSKMAWVARPLPPPLVDMLGDRAVNIDGKILYLGEDEKLVVPLPFWQTNYNEIVSILSNEAFLAFAGTAELCEIFVSKFSEMKSSFLGTVGSPSEMAVACFKDLIAIHERLYLSEGFVLAQKIDRRSRHYAESQAARGGARIAG